MEMKKVKIKYRRYEGELEELTYVGTGTGYCLKIIDKFKSKITVYAVNVKEIIFLED